jgi:hypothetical protein
MTLFCPTELCRANVQDEFWEALGGGNFSADAIPTLECPECRQTHKINRVYMSDGGALVSFAVVVEQALTLPDTTSAVWAKLEQLLGTPLKWINQETP